MTRTKTPRRRHSWRERTFVLGGFALAAPYTVAAAVLGLDMETVGAAWLAAVLWTVPTSLTLALRRGFVHRDWSAFAGHDFPEDDGELDEWSSRTGRYQYLADMEERLLRNDDHLR